MGISINYRGRINPADMGELIEDMKSICYQHGWGFTVFRDGEIAEQEKAIWSVEEQQTPEEVEERKSRSMNIEETIPLTGIIIDVEEKCEGVWLLFDAKGELYSLIGWILQRDGALSPDNNWVFTKTQFSSLKAHVQICDLLRYLQKRYFVELEVSDEAEYWETGDMDMLYKKREFLGGMISKLATALRNAEPPTDEERENPELFMKRIAGIADEIGLSEGLNVEIREIGPDEKNNTQKNLESPQDE